MSDQDPPIQGVVVGHIGPIKASKLLLHNAGKASANAEGQALYLPRFTHDVSRDDNGDVVAASVECVPETLEQASIAARRVIAAMEKLPLTMSSVDVMNIAFAVLHYENAKKENA